jgi:hypothetical protein
MEIDELRKRVQGEEFDYQLLLDVLHEYDQPRSKIKSWLKSKTLIRVKKGLYVFGEAQARRPYSREVLANLIYGPSYISLDYALHYYGLIPERAETVTCCTVGRGRSFVTPVGRFQYRQIPAAAYAIGVDCVELDNGRSCLIAVPEKALADKLQAERGAAIANPAELRTYLMDHLRMNPAGLKTLNHALLARLAKAYASRRLRWLEDIL